MSVIILSVDNIDYPVYKNTLVDEVLKFSSNECEKRTSRGGLRFNDVENALGVSHVDLTAVKWLRDWVCTVVNDSFGNLVGSSPLRLRMDNSWFMVNRALSGDWNVPHIHNGSLFSGVFYVNASESKDVGNLYIMEPNISAFCDGGNSRTMNDMSDIQPVEGRLLVWNSDLVHFVGPNLSSEDRIAYSFNMIPFNPLTGVDYSISHSDDLSSSLGMLVKAISQKRGSGSGV